MSDVRGLTVFASLYRAIAAGRDSAYEPILSGVVSFRSALPRALRSLPSAAQKHTAVKKLLAALEDAVAKYNGESSSRWKLLYWMTALEDISNKNETVRETESLASEEMNEFTLALRHFIVEQNKRMIHMFVSTTKSIQTEH